MSDLKYKLGWCQPLFDAVDAIIALEIPNKKSKVNSDSKKEGDSSNVDNNSRKTSSM